MDVKTWPEMEAKNDKETINLLDLLSDSESTVSDIVLTPKKKRVKRRYRPGGSASRDRQGGSCMCGRSQTRSLALWLAAVSITSWLLALSWFATILYSDIRKMDSSIRSAIVDIVKTARRKHVTWEEVLLCFTAQTFYLVA